MATETTTEQADAPDERDEAALEELDEEELDGLSEFILDVYEGETTLQESFGVEEATIEAIQQRAYTFYVNERYEQAEPLARGLVALDSERFYPNLLLGDILFQQGPGVSEQAEEVVVDVEEEKTRLKSRFEESLEAFERAQKQEPDDEFVNLRLSELYLKDGQNEKARELLEDLAADAQDKMTREWAEALLDAGEASEAN